VRARQHEGGTLGTQTELVFAAKEGIGMRCFLPESTPERPRVQVARVQEVR
jgi:hypothetical protein